MVVTIIGARPQFIKAAVVSKAFKEVGIEEHIIHTGQHYDQNMSDVFWEELGIPLPILNLNIGSGHHGEQTAKMIEGIENYILSLERKVKAILLYGDTNSTLAGAIIASKLKDVKCIHIESGLRSFNRKMPEEVNRIITDHVSDLLFCSSENGIKQLKKEGITAPAYNVGDVMYDAINMFSSIIANNNGIVDVEEYVKGISTFSLLTLHRPSNTDDIHIMQEIMFALGELSDQIIWLVHPRVKNKINSLRVPINIHMRNPASYFQMISLLNKCERVFTDSGGLQKEAYWKKKQCITLRSETEWIETIEGNWNILAGNDRKRIIEAAQKKPISKWKPIYGDGTSSKIIAEIVKKHLEIN